MTTFTDDNEKLELLTKIARSPPEQLKPVMKAMDRADMLAEFAKLPAFDFLPSNRSGRPKSCCKPMSPWQPRCIRTKTRTHAPAHPASPDLRNSHDHQW